MTGWGVLLLALFFVLGLGSAKTGKAMTLSVCLTALVLTVALAGYMR
ncbi:MAG TPA: hypothetical protein VH420_00610 [Gaiellaceae bacterium]|jgi:hypothetical protein